VNLVEIFGDLLRSLQCGLDHQAECSTMRGR
jgi:hypothetical protein